jgi:hypothetical protein
VQLAVSSVPTPNREVHLGDGVAWLRQAQLGVEHAVVTSLPDYSELPGLQLLQWQAWFSSTVQLVSERIAFEAVAIFYQTDIKHQGRWVDKGYLVQKGAEAAGAHVLWHKIVCRVAPGTTTFGRPAYAHLICVSRGARVDPGRSTPDVIPRAGAMTWPRAMPMEACEESCRFLRRETDCRIVVDPFCGVGTILAVANAHGFSAVGVELSRKRANKARALAL